MIEVVVEDGLAIIGEILLGVGLAFGGIEFGKSLGVDLLVASDVKCADESLRTFFDLNVNREVVLGAVIVVIDFGLNFGLAESVGNVQGLEIGDVALEQCSAVASEGKELAGG